MSGGMARWWWYDVSELLDRDLFASGLESLPWADRRAKVGRYRFAKDRNLCLGAGLLCAHALGAVGVNDAAIAYGAHGKPYVPSRPDVCFNLSHSGTVAVCAVGDTELGIDIERRHAYDRDIAKMCFTKEEQHWVRAQSNKSEAFTRLWTRKESYLKMLGTGLSVDAKSFSAVPGDTSALGVRFWECGVEDYFVCLCLSPRARLESIQEFAFSNMRAGGGEGI